MGGITVSEIIENNFTENEKKLVKKIYDEIIYHVFVKLEKLESQVKAIDKRLPSKLKEADTLDVINEGIAVVDFWAEWCVPCYDLLPALETVAKEFEDVKFYKINIDKHPDIAKEMGIRSIPLIVVYKDGKEIDRMVGSPKQKKEDYLRWMIKRAFVPAEEWEKTKKMVEKIAKAKGWHLNPDKFIREGLISALTYNRLNYGKMYCPCKPEHVKENICPCKPYGDYIGSDMRIQEEGICYCGLFVSDEYMKEWNKYMKERMKRVAVQKENGEEGG